MYICIYTYIYLCRKLIIKQKTKTNVSQSFCILVTIRHILEMPLSEYIAYIYIYICSIAYQIYIHIYIYINIDIDIYRYIYICIYHIMFNRNLVDIYN